MRYHFIRTSANSKTGPIPTTYNSRSTCPPSCSQYRAGCYAEDFYTRLIWDKVDSRGHDIHGLAAAIAKLPKGQLWRMSVAGDLPGEGETVDAHALGLIVKANKGRRGFTYTHKKSPDAIKWAGHATQWGFTVNLSADNAGEADTLAATGLPVVCIVPRDTPRHSKTPAGRPIVICPAQTMEDMTCSNCGLCQQASRRAIVGFRAHGTRARQAEHHARKIIPIATA